MQIEFISGKGGVGKSAVSAAVARLHARRGERVLAMSMIPGGALASHLGLRRLGFVPELAIDGVHAMEVARADALEEYVRLYSPVPLVAQLGRAVRVFDVLAEAAPGVREIVTIGKVAYEAWEGSWDRIVVDAVPSGQLESHILAPEVIAELIPTGRVRDQAARIEQLLRDDTLVHLVTLAEELPITETHETLARLETLAPTVAPVIANRLLAPPPSSGDLPESAPSAARTALALHAEISAEQTRWLAELADGPRLPYLFGTDDPILVSEYLAKVMEAWR